MAKPSIILPFGERTIFDRTASAAAPTAPVISNVVPGNQQNTVTWGAVSGATGYKVYFDTSSGVSTSDSVLDVGAATSIVHSGLTNGTTYYYKVQALGVNDDSALSNEDSGTPNLAAFANTLSLNLNGSTQWIDFGNNHNYDNATAWSLTGWIRPNNLAAQHTIWAKASNDGNVFGWGLYQTTAGKLLVQARASGQLRSHTSTGTFFTALTWAFFGMTYAGGQNMNGLKLYSGAGLDSTASSGAITNTLLHTDPSRIGVRNSTQPMSGHVDHFVFWGRELTAGEINEAYNSGSAGNIFDHSQAAYIDHYYPIGEGDTAPTVLDGVGSVDGTIAGGATFDTEVA